jgi:hypothetical protein
MMKPYQKRVRNHISIGQKQRNDKYLRRARLEPSDAQETAVPDNTMYWINLQGFVPGYKEGMSICSFETPPGKDLSPCARKAYRLPSLRDGSYGFIPGTRPALEEILKAYLPIRFVPVSVDGYISFLY